MDNYPMSGSASMYSLAGVAVAGVSAAAAATLARRERTYLPRGHASRVDTCRDPLGRAMRYGCAGMTVGVEVGPDGRLRLARAAASPVARESAPGGATAPGAGAAEALTLPTQPVRAAVATADRAGPPATSADPARTLRRLVFDPLIARVRATGRVHSAQHQPFSVVLEPAGGVAPTHVLDALEDELGEYTDMLTRCVAGRVRHGPVLMALANAPRGVLHARESRLFFAEGTLADVDRRVPTTVVPLVGEHIAWRLGWDGRGEMPGEERHMLRALIATAHAEGKRVRVFGVPETRRAVRRAYWRELHAAGVDLIGACDVASLRRFLRAQRAHR
jgi:hypothetical protein